MRFTIYRQMKKDRKVQSCKTFNETERWEIEKVELNHLDELMCFLAKYVIAKFKYFSSDEKIVKVFDAPNNENIKSERTYRKVKFTIFRSGEVKSKIKPCDEAIPESGTWIVEIGKFDDFIHLLDKYKDLAVAIKLYGKNMMIIYDA